MLVYPEGQLATLERAEYVLTSRWHVAPMLVYPDGQSATRDAWAVVLVATFSNTQLDEDAVSLALLVIFWASQR